MGTEVQYKNSFPGYYYSMRNVNEDSNSSGWSIFYGDNSVTNGHYYNGFAPRTVTDEFLGYEKDELKQKMLQHEYVFKNQVYELHRLYRRQRDMMEEAKRNEFHKYHIPLDTSSSSTRFPSQNPNENHHKWHIPSPKPSIFGANINNSPQKDCELVECRPLKVRKKLFDLQLPPDEYVEPEENEQIQDNQVSEISSYPSKENHFVPKNGVKMFGQHFTGSNSNGLADLNEPVYVQEENGVNYLGPSTKPAMFNHLWVEGKGNGREMFSCYMREPGNTQSTMSFTSRYFESNKLQTPSDTMQMQHLHEISTRNQTHSHFNQNPLLFASNSWSPWGPSWEKPNDGLTRKLTSFQTHPWQRMNTGSGSGSDIPARNGFYHGSTSGSTRLTSVGFDYRNCKKIDDGSRKIFKDSNFIDLTEPDTTKGVDLNNTFQDLCNEDEDSRKHEHTTLPWLRNKPASDQPKEKDVLKNDFLTERRGININVAWDDAMDVESCNENKNFKNLFDLNSCVTEDEEELVVTDKSLKNTLMEIDLEAWPVSENAEEDTDQHELTKLAAEAIVVMSSQQDYVGSMVHDDPLLWFVEVVICAKNEELTREMDEYETLTLRLVETKEEDYMPAAPLVPLEFREQDKVGPGLLNRPRRGQARRGRPRRDFQRDILPGLVSLSRHEITEDLQVFGGLMKATGHSWCFSTRKRFGGRGRRKPPPAAIGPPELSPELCKKVSGVEMVGLGEGSLTGWGKTTRRPRKQRCAGNSITVQLT